MLKIKDGKFKCIDCDCEIEVPKDVMNGEILTCNDCGMEYKATVKEGKVKIDILVFEGIDWGE